MRLKQYTLSTPLICLMLISCGGGGGGGALDSPSNPSYTYISIQDCVDDGGCTYPNTIGAINVQKPDESDGVGNRLAWGFLNSASISLSVPAANGSQTISFEIRKTWPDDYAGFGVYDYSWNLSYDSDRFANPLEFKGGQINMFEDFFSSRFKNRYLFSF